MNKRPLSIAIISVILMVLGTVLLIALLVETPDPGKAQRVAEFKAQRVTDRNFVARLLLATALRLVAPLYNYQPPRTLQQAIKDLRREIS